MHRVYAVIEHASPTFAKQSSKLNCNRQKGVIVVHTNIQIGSVGIPIIKGALLIHRVQDASSFTPDPLPLLTLFLLPMM